MKKYLSVLIMFLSANTLAANWIQTGKTKQDTVWLDLDSIADAGVNGKYYKKAWVKYKIYNDVVKDNLTIGDYTMLLYHIDCFNKKMGNAMILNYKNNNLYGNTQSFNFPNMDDVVPDTVGETIFNRVCESKEHKENGRAQKIIDAYIAKNKKPTLLPEVVADKYYNNELTPTQVQDLENDIKDGLVKLPY